MIKKSLLVAICLTTGISTFSQDFISSQNAAGNIIFNPALAGNDNTGRLTLNYRNQWPNLTANYVTMNGNFYQYIPKANGYGGIRFQNDNEAGIINTSYASLFYGQNINVGNVLIRPAIEVGYGSRKLDWSKLTFGDPMGNQDIYQTGDVPAKARTFFDVNVGTVVAYKNLTVGVSAHHINQPNVSMIEGEKSILGPRIGAQISYVHSFENIKLNVAPFAVYDYQNGFQSTRAGLNFLYKKHYNVSFAMQNRDAFILNLGYQTTVFAINYSYDATISRLNNGVSGGAHELSLILKFWKTKTVKKLIEVNSVFQ